jgi:molecular chaperone GrpE
MAMKDLFRRGGKEKKNMNKEHVKQEAPPAGANDGSNDTPDRDTTDSATAGQDETSSNGDPVSIEGELDILRTEHQALHDKHLRLFAEFDNFRKRTAKEKLEMLQFAGENTLKAVLPILDDMARAIASNESAKDITPVKEGLKLIHQKLQNLLGSQGLKRMEVKKGDPFDTDKHEAITKIPAESDQLKGAVMDVVEEGYLLHDKVIRYARVVVGE